MRLRYWSVKPATGDVLGELVMSGPVSFSHKYGGGAFSGSVKLDFELADGLQDWAWVEQLEARTRPWSRTIVVTDDKRTVLGEWIITVRRAATNKAAYDLTGITWEEFPAYQTMRNRVAYTDALQGQIAQDLFERAFAGVPITLPIAIPGTAAHTLTWDLFSCYIADALDDLADGANGFEWCVDTTGVWAGDQLVGVQRTLVCDQPVLRRGEPLEIVAGGPRPRHGNAVIMGVGGGTRWATEIMGLGAGSGAKQLSTAWTYSPSGSAWSYPPGDGALPSSRNITQPAIRTPAILQGMVNEAGERAKASRDAYQVDALIDDLEFLPRLGYRARLTAPRSWGFPAGLNTTLRIGEISYRADGHNVARIGLQAA